MNRPLLPAHRRILLLYRCHAKALGIVVLVALGLSTMLSLTESDVSWLARTSGLVATVVVLALPVILAADVRTLTGPEGALWIQKPVGVVPFQLARFAEAWVAAAGVGLAFALVAVLASAETPWRDPGRLAVILASPCLYALVVGAATFGLSAWLGRAGRVAVVGLLVASLVFGLQRALASVPGGPGAVDGLWVVVVETVLIPVEALVTISDFGEGAAPAAAMWRAVTWLLGYAAAWVLIGVAGIRWTLASGRVARPSPSG